MSVKLIEYSENANNLQNYNINRLNLIASPFFSLIKLKTIYILVTQESFLRIGERL